MQRMRSKASLLTRLLYRASMASLAPPLDRSTAAPSALLRRTVPAALLFGGIIAWLSYDLLLLCRFLGMGGPWLHAGWAVLTVGLFWLLTLPRRADLLAGPTVATLLVCIAAATLLMVLGGEGRILYANLDWQVRDAVLSDMVANPWPFAYPDGAMLRAPIGMYLAPALVGKAWGRGAGDMALLAQNAVFLGVLLAIGSTLFAGRRRQSVALALFLLFSGLDILGQIKVGHAAGLTPSAHLEGWGPSQYSSTLTLAFWVPQHALAGWLGALAILLWRERRLGLGALLMLPPLLALWSPFAAIGMLPFLCVALASEARYRRIRPADLLLPGIASAMALPALLYLAAGSGAVGLRLFPIAPAIYLSFLTIEILPFLLISMAGLKARFGGALFVTAALFLLVAPLIQIGGWIDFAMRATIPALAILIAHLADMMSGGWPASTRRKGALALLLAIGAATPLTETVRALTYPPSPLGRCSVSRAWDETFAVFPKSGYFANPLDLPGTIRPTRLAQAPDDQGRACFDRPWQRPELF